MIGPIRRGNYNSGEDFVLEYGELHFTFNEKDFRERTEHAALMLRFIQSRLYEDEQDDLVNLTVNGGIREAQSPLGDHIAEQDEAVLEGQPDNPGLIHWLRRMVFQGAWLDQCVSNGELDFEFIPETGSFEYFHVNLPQDRVQTAPGQTWEAVAYQGTPGT